MTILSLTAKTVLKTAANRTSGSILPMPNNIKGAVAKKMFDSLLAKGMINAETGTISQLGYIAAGVEPPQPIDISDPNFLDDIAKKYSISDEILLTIRDIANIVKTEAEANADAQDAQDAQAAENANSLRQAKLDDDAARDAITLANAALAKTEAEAKANADAQAAEADARSEARAIAALAKVAQAAQAVEDARIAEWAALDAERIAANAADAQAEADEAEAAQTQDAQDAQAEADDLAARAYANAIQAAADAEIAYQEATITYAAAAAAETAYALASAKARVAILIAEVACEEATETFRIANTDATFQIASFRFNTTAPAKPKDAIAKPKTTRTNGSPISKEGSKQDNVIKMLKRPEGATNHQLAGETGWLAHTIRGFISTAKKKLGLDITTKRSKSEDNKSITTYFAN